MRTLQYLKKIITPQKESSSHYGISGDGVSRPGIQNKKDFCIKINLPKEKLLNFENWANDEPQ